MSSVNIKTEVISELDYPNPLKNNGTLLNSISDEVISKISDLIAHGSNIPCSRDSSPSQLQSDDDESQSDEETNDDDGDEYSVESEPSVQSDDSYTPNKQRRSTYRSLMKEARRIAQTTKKSDLKNGSDVQWLRCGSFDSWEKVEAFRRHKRVVIKDTTFMSRGVSKGATKTNYRCTTWNTIKCPYKMYSVIKEGDTTYEMFEANEHSPLCEKILAVKLPLDMRKYKRNYKQQRQSWNYPGVQKAMEQFVKDKKTFKNLDELVSELATIFDKQSCTLNLKYYLTHYSDSSKILEQLIPDWLISNGWFASYSERRNINRQIKVKEASQRLLKAAQEKLCREERLRIFKQSNTIREPQFSQRDATALGQIQLDNDSKRITRNFPRIEHDYHLLSYCKPVTEFKTKNEAMRYCYKRPLLRVNTGNSERAVKYRCHVRGCEHAVYCVQAENGNFVVWSNEEHNHDDDKFFVSLVDERDVKKAYAGSGRRLFQFNPTDAEVAVNNANNSYSETASCSTAVQNKSNSDNFGYVTNDMKRSSNRYANGFMKFNSRVDAHIYLTSRGMRQSAYVPEWGSNGSKYRLTYKCSEKDCPFIMTGSLYYDKSWGYATQIQLWMHHHHSHPEFMKDWQRKLPESSSPPNDQVRPAKLRRIEVVNGDKNDGLVSGRAFDSECQTKSNISPVDSVIKTEPLSEMSECNIQKSTNDDRSNPSRNDPVIKSEPPSETSEFIADGTSVGTANSKKTVSSIRPENGNRGSENRIVTPVSIPANSVNTFYNRGKSGDSEPTKFNGADTAQTSYDANCLNSSSFIPVVKEEPPSEITAFDTTFRQSQDARESVHKVAQRNNEPAASTSKESCLITNRLVTKTGNGATLAEWRRPKLKVVLKSTNSNRPLHLRFLNPVLTPVRRSVNTGPVSVNTDSDNAIQRCGQLEPTSGAPKLSIKSKSIENGASIRHDRTTEQSLNEFQNKSTFSPINAVIKPEPVSEMSECNSYNTEPIASTSTQTSVKSKSNENAVGVSHRRNTEQSLNEFKSKSTFSPDALVIKAEPVSEMSEYNMHNSEPIASTSAQPALNAMEEMTGLCENSNAACKPFQQYACESRFPNRVVHWTMDETISNVANRLSPDLASKQEGLKKKASQYQKKRTRIQYIDENVAGCARCRPFTFDTLITAVRKNKYHFFTVSRLQQEEEQNRRSTSEPENEQDMEVIDEHHGNENLQRGSLTATKEMEHNQPTASVHGIQSNAEIKFIGKRPGKRTAGNESNLTEIERLRQEVEKLKAEKQEYLKTIEELQECSQISEPTYCVI